MFSDKQQHQQTGGAAAQKVEDDKLKLKTGAFLTQPAVPVLQQKVNIQRERLQMKEAGDEEGLMQTMFGEQKSNNETIQSRFAPQQAVTNNTGSPVQSKFTAPATAAPVQTIQPKWAAPEIQLKETEALQFKPAGFVRTVISAGNVIQLHKGKNEEDPTTDEMIIYTVTRKSDGNIVYIGQTELNVGIAERFKQHMNSGYHNDWSDATHKIAKVDAGDWTRFETCCAEQYWIDHYGGKGSLENAKNQISLARFKRMLEWQEENKVTIYRGEAASFPKGWKPLQKL